MLICASSEPQRRASYSTVFFRSFQLCGSAPGILIPRQELADEAGLVAVGLANGSNASRCHTYRVSSGHCGVDGEQDRGVPAFSRQGFERFGKVLLRLSYAVDGLGSTDRADRNGWRLGRPAFTHGRLSRSPHAFEISFASFGQDPTGSGHEAMR